MKETVSKEERLSHREVAGYGLGDLACSMVFNFMASYLLYYYTDVAGLGISLSGSVSFLILGETIDHAEYATSVRQQGLLTSMSMFMVKLGVMASSALSAFVLEIGGYAPDQPQTPSALAAIRANFILLPAMAGAVCLLLFLFYRLDREYPMINEALARKREARQP